MIEFWIDGSANPNPGTGGWAVVGTDNGSSVHLRGGETGTTNNRMEMMALIEALRYIGEQEALIHMDSDYVRIGLLEWAQKWKSNGWRHKKGKTVPNMDLWETLLLLYTPSVQLVYVKSDENLAHGYAEEARKALRE